MTGHDGLRLAEYLKEMEEDGLLLKFGEDSSLSEPTHQIDDQVSNDMDKSYPCMTKKEAADFRSEIWAVLNADRYNLGPRD